MPSPRLLAQVVATALVTGGLLLLALALTGTAPDWLMRCGGRFLRHDCAPGEIPVRGVLIGALLLVVGLATAGGEISVRDRRVVLGRRPSRDSFPPPGA